MCCTLRGELGQIQTEILFCLIQCPTHVPSNLHWRFGIVVIVQEGRQTLNDGVGAGDLLGTTCCGDGRFAHDFVS